MDVAYRKSDLGEYKNLVHAWEFTDMTDDQIDPYDFYCPYPCCHIDQKLVSHQQKIKTANKLQKDDNTGNKAGYFRVPRKNLEHHPDCPEHKNNRSKKKKVNGIDPRLPHEHISKIIFRNDSTSTEHVRNSRGKKLGDPEERHQHQAYHISNAVMWYLQNPHQGNKHIHLDGCEFQQYRDVFQRIVQNTHRRYIGKHLYFGSLDVRNSDNFDIVNGKAVFYVYQYDEENKSLPIKVYLTIDKFSKYKFDMVNKTYRYADRKRKELKPKNKVWPKTWIFFYGEPIEPGAREFIVERHDCIYFYPEFTLDLPTNNHFYVEPEPEPEPEVIVEQILNEDREKVLDQFTASITPVIEELIEDVQGTTREPQDKVSNQRSVPSRDLDTNVDIEVKLSNVRPPHQEYKVSLFQRLKNWLAG